MKKDKEPILYTKGNPFSSDGSGIIRYKDRMEYYIYGVMFYSMPVDKNYKNNKKIEK